MGFFLTDEQEQATVKNNVTRRPKPKKLEILEGQTGCANCGLQTCWPRITSPQIKTHGGKDADILLLTDKPTADDDYYGRLLAATDARGRTNPAKSLHDLLPARDRDRYAFQGLVRCHADSIKPQDINACSEYLEADIERLGIKYIIGLGQAPLARYWPGANIARVHGIRFPVKIGTKTIWYYPIMDPWHVETHGGMRTPLGTVFRADLKRFFTEHKSWGKPVIAELSPKQVICPKSENEARALVTKMRGPLGVDIETAAGNRSVLKPMEFGARIISGAISDTETTIAFPVDHPEHKTEWGLPLLLEVAQTRRWIAHNSTFEILWFLHHLPNDKLGYLAETECTQALCRLLFERETMRKLEECTKALLGVDVKDLTEVNAKNIMGYPLAEVLPYNGLDARACALMWQRQYKFTENNEGYARLKKSAYTLAIMELKGLPVDLEASQTLFEEWNSKKLVAETAATKLYEVKQFEQFKGKKFNIGSPIDVGEALVEYGRLKLPRNQRGYVTDDATLTAAIEKGRSHPLIDAVLEYRGATKMISTYIEPIIEVPKRFIDGCAHPGYTTTKTATLRLSSNDFNIQNWPKRTHPQMRRQIVPPPNHLVCPVDYGQLEARLIGIAAKDKFLCSSIINGYDIHQDWLERVLGAHPPYMDYLADKLEQTDEAKVRKGGRTIIKTDFVFSSFYGAMAKSVSERTGIPLQVVEELLYDFWKMFPGVAAWIKARREEYREHGIVRTTTGRVRRGIFWGNECINNPIQGTAADVVSDAMNAIAAVSIELQEPALFPRINVHDDLTFFLPDVNENQLMEYIDIIGEVLTERRYPWQIVPFMVEVSIGKNWCDVQEIAKITGDYIR